MGDVLDIETNELPHRPGDLEIKEILVAQKTTLPHRPGDLESL